MLHNPALKRDVPQAARPLAQRYVFQKIEGGKS